MYRLDNTFARHRFTVTVVGCGGTGGFVAEGLCRLLPPSAQLVLVDHDRVEEGNLLRQNFTMADLERFKSEALAENLARRYGRPVAYSVLPAALATFKDPGVVIGCVDNGLARGDIAQKMSHHYQQLWWVDAGNGENYGQILIGSHKEVGLTHCFDPERRICFALPLPTIQRPELLIQAPRVRDCAVAVMAGDQGPVINQAMAALVVEVTRRLIEGNCLWMQVYLDLEAGALVPVPITPETVATMTGLPKRSIERR